MARKGGLKRRVGLWLHRWLVKLRLLKNPWRDRHSTDSPPIINFEQITLKEIGQLTIEQPKSLTIENPAHIINDHSKQVSIEHPKRVTIDGDPALLIKHPATVMIQVQEDQELVLLENATEQPRTPVPIEAANGSGPFTFLHLDTVRVTDAEQLTLNSDLLS